jgi:anti-anti-sigma factor
VDRSLGIVSNDVPQMLALQGELDLATRPELEQRLWELIEGGTTSLVIDLSECTFIDVVGAGGLVNVAGRLGDRHGGSIRLINLSRQARRLLELIDIGRWVETEPASGVARG